MIDPTQQSLIARKLGTAPIGLFGAHAYIARYGRVQSVEDLKRRDVIGFDRDDAIIKGYAANGMSVTRDDFAVRCDDQMVYWNLLLAGAGLGFAQTLIARRRPELEQVDIDMHMPPLPVWLVMHEEVRSNARIRRVADYLSAALGDILRDI